MGFLYSPVFDGIDVTELGDKGIHGIEGDLEVFRADVEIEKTMVAGIEVDECTLVSFAFHSFDKVGNHIVWRDGVTFPMDHQGGWEFSAEVVEWVVFCRLLGVGESVEIDNASVDIYDGTDGDDRLRLGRVGVDDLKFFSHGE